MKKVARLFQIKTKVEVFLITYPLALGAVKRGQEYMLQYPGKIGWLFLALTCGAVFLASAKMLQAVELQQMFGQE
ncbi:MAG: hypothetical protein LW742_10440 [Sphingomonadales bacterium]|jgi:hypothetical protein|nr:hypothetical protein [Sphingomonadales bacterium]